MTTIGTQIVEIVREHLGLDDQEAVTPASTFLDLGADSLDRVELVLAVEEQFGLVIPDSDLERLETVGDVIAYVTARVAPAGA